LKHKASEVAHDRLGLKMKVTKHFIRAPAADQADNICVDVGKEKGHGATGAKGVGVNVGRRRPRRGPRAAMERRRAWVMSEGVTGW
jgi:hypothetical protein